MFCTQSFYVLGEAAGSFGSLHDRIHSLFSVYRRHSLGCPRGGEQEEGQHCLAIVDFACLDLCEQNGEREVMKFDSLIGLGFCDAGAHVFCEEDLDMFGEEARACEEADELRPASRAEAGFLDQLALRGGKGSFAKLDTSGRNLIQKLPCGVAILTFEQDGWVIWVGRRVDDEDGDGAVVTDDFARAGDAPWFGNSVGGDGEDLALKAEVRFENRGLPWGRFASGKLRWRGPSGKGCGRTFQLGGFATFSGHAATVSFWVASASAGIQEHDPISKAS